MRVLKIGNLYLQDGALGFWIDDMQVRVTKDTIECRVKYTMLLTNGTRKSGWRSAREIERMLYDGRWKLDSICSSIRRKQYTK